MKYDEIIDFVKSRVEPLPSFAGSSERYRVSAVLNDGTFLPCVVLEECAPRVTLALRRFKETRGSDDSDFGHRGVVSAFIAGNCVSEHDLREIRLSNHAIALARMREIKGETSMSWTQFYAEMSDGEKFCFGTTFSTEFFDMPESYCASDIIKIVPAAPGARPSDGEPVYRQRPYFTCYIGNPY